MKIRYYIYYVTLWMALGWALGQAGITFKNMSYWTIMFTAMMLVIIQPLNRMKCPTCEMYRKLLDGGMADLAEAYRGLKELSQVRIDRTQNYN